MSGVWNYKIMVVVTTDTGGITSQLLHYQEYDNAETAYGELEKSPEVPGLKMAAIRLYKREERYGKWR